MTRVQSKRIQYAEIFGSLRLLVLRHMATHDIAVLISEVPSNVAMPSYGYDFNRCLFARPTTSNARIDILPGQCHVKGLHPQELAERRKDVGNHSDNARQTRLTSVLTNGARCEPSAGLIFAELRKKTLQ